MRNGGRHIPTEATWFYRWSSSTRTGPLTSMDWSLEYQLCFQAWLQSGLLLLSSLVVVAVFSELVSPCGAAGVTSHSGGLHGTFDFTGEVRFAQCRQSHPDRSNLVSSMVYGSDAGTLDFDGLEFGVSVVSSSLASPLDRSDRGASLLACFLDRHSSL